MRVLLLDTIAFDLLLRNPAQIPAKTRTQIERADDVLVSMVSLWELSNHARDGKLVLNMAFDDYIKQALLAHDLTLLPLQWEALTYMSTFQYQLIERVWSRTTHGKTTTGIKQDWHKDTFDRMLIAHAITGQLPIVSPDELFPYYQPSGLQIVW
jgi:PIN domain nuclease of toxin-antitoxin system